jgi:hypothetical protein
LTAALLQQEVQMNFKKVTSKPIALFEGSVGMAKPLPALLANPDPNS